MTVSNVDIRIENHGTIFLFHPCSDAGRGFLTEHAPEDAHWWGLALVIEHRYAYDWAGYALAEGLTLQ